MSSVQSGFGLPPSEIQDRLSVLQEQMQSASGRQVGFPGNQNFDYSALLPFFEYALNNLGDPFHNSIYRSNTHQIEREVIAHFARLTRIDPAQAWGYVTSGGTEGNMYGLYLAREHFPTECSISPRTPTTASSRTCGC